MKIHRSFVTLLVLAALAGAAAGCGGDDEPTRAEFQQAVVSSIERVNYAIQRIPKADSPEETFIRMDEASVAIEDASSALEDTGAPEQFDDEAKKLVKSLDQLAVDLEATAADLRNPELGFGLENLPRGFEFESWTDANEALAGMIGDGLQVPIIESS